MALSKETLDFLVENRIQNSRSWFLGHRKEYQKYVKQPLLELAQQLAVCAAEIDPDIIAVPSRAVSRINRDTRFTKDKALYRDVMWCAFSRDKKVYDTPCALVLEFSPMGFRYGCGYWQTPPKTLEAMRELILADSPLFRKAEKARSSSSLFALEGDCYKRSRFPEQPYPEKLTKQRDGRRPESPGNTYKRKPTAYAVGFRLYSWRPQAVVRGSLCEKEWPEIVFF